tara:strand:- start:954 stop:1454 length:501 start_codon:yes stop_codon:yes gene_type:complete
MSAIVAQLRPTISTSVVKGKTVKKPKTLYSSVSTGVKKTVSSKDTKGKDKEFKNINQRVNLPSNVVDYLVKAERVNGRAAMIGFTSAVIEELVTNNSISTQFMDNIGVTMSVIGLVIIGTASNPRDEGLLWGVFDRNAETVNGRLAMLGILSLYLSEYIMPTTPLF